jgi:hypothetical protein
MLGLAIVEQKWASLQILHLQFKEGKKPLGCGGMLVENGSFRRIVDRDGSFLKAGNKEPTGNIFDARGQLLRRGSNFLMISLRSGRAGCICVTNVH